MYLEASTTKSNRHGFDFDSNVKSMEMPRHHFWVNKSSADLRPFDSVFISAAVRRSFENDSCKYDSVFDYDSNHVGLNAFICVVSLKAEPWLQWEGEMAKGHDASLRVLRKVKSLELEKSDRQAGRVLMSYIETCLRYRALSDVNDLLARFDSSQYSLWSILSVLRTTYRVKKVLPAWESLLKSSRSVLDERQLDSTRLLFGLDK